MLRRVDGGLDLDLDAIALTDAQRAALAIDRHIVVSAGAGSGKTHTLAWRYVRLLLAHASSGRDDIEAVVVLTFTEKAADEMASRCHSRLLQCARAARELEPSIATRLDRMIDRFDQARIGTFHSFCARILREFPSGDIQDRAILEAHEAGGLVRGAAERTVLAWARTTPERLATLMDAFGSRRTLVDAVQRGLLEFPRIDAALERHATGKIALDLESLGAQTERARNWLTKQGWPTLTVIERLVRQGASKFATRVRGIAHPQPLDDPLHVHRIYQQALGVLLNEQGQLRSLTHHSVVGQKARWGDPRRYSQAKAALQAISETVADWPERFEHARFLPTAADARLMEVLPHFARLLREAHDLQTAQLDARGALDFDALQSLAVEAVLENSPLRDTLRARHRWLMVDEFQDTDSRQWAMVRALGDPAPGEVADRIFLVGDVKQAIYGFRGGEVALFAEAARHLRAEPITLPENFRTLPGLIDWFNLMFPRVLPEMWSPMIAARPAGDGQVVWIDAKGATEQATAAARWIAQTLPSLSPSAEPAIAILLRTRTHLGTWESCLRQAGVPYQVGQGVGFWARPEIRDVVVVLHAAITRDRLSEVGALRVPWIGATDPQVDAYVLRKTPLPALDDLHRIAERRKDRPISQWVMHLLDTLDAPRFWDESARANVAQLLETLADWDREGVTLFEIARRLLQRILEVPRETEASPAASQAQVILLTVHASKGLEFPIVMLPELERSPVSRSPALAIGEVDGQTAMAFRVDDQESDVQTHTHPALLTRIHHAQREVDHAEYRRLLYVALTRARDQLVLIGPQEAPERSWAGLLSDPPSTTRHLDGSTLEAAKSSLSSAGRQWRVERQAAGEMTPQIEVTASDLMGFEHCAAHWFRTRRLGLPLPNTPLDQGEIASRLGSVVHSVIEDRVFENSELSERRWRHAAAGLPDSQIDAGRKRLHTHRKALMGNDEVQRVLDAPGFDELAVRTAFSGGVFLGRIDRLYIDRERAGFVVLDYKTESLRGRSPAQAATSHTPQLLAYAWAVTAVLAARSQPPVVGAQVLFTGAAQSAFLGPWSETDWSTIPQRLTRLAQTTSLDAAMGHAATQEPDCAGCAFLGAGCSGVGDIQPGLFETR